MAQSERSVFTIAFGNSIYLNMAIALARSYCRFNDFLRIPFTIYTDKPLRYAPKDLRVIHWKPLPIHMCADTFLPKIFLDQLSPTQKSIFLDSDCICVRSLEQAFDDFNHRPVGVLGREISNGYWYGDISSICRDFNINEMPRFNGGLYYLEKGCISKKVFDSARKLYDRYDEIGFARLRSAPNDEVLVSLAMALHGQKAITDRGVHMLSTRAAGGGLYIDTIKGDARLLNPKSSPTHNSWYDFESASPSVVHFLANDASRPPYKTEIIKLRLIAQGWPLNIIRIYADIHVYYSIIFLRTFRLISRFCKYNWISNSKFYRSINCFIEDRFYRDSRK